MLELDSKNVELMSNDYVRFSDKMYYPGEKLAEWQIVDLPRRLVVLVIGCTYICDEISVIDSKRTEALFKKYTRVGGTPLIKEVEDCGFSYLETKDRADYYSTLFEDRICIDKWYQGTRRDVVLYRNELDKLAKYLVEKRR